MSYCLYFLKGFFFLGVFRFFLKYGSWGKKLRFWFFFFGGIGVSLGEGGKGLVVLV